MDSRYKKYQQACIRTLETTLNIETIFFTMFLNFNISFNEYLNAALKLQMHISEATMVLDDLEATLHYQMIFQIQNHTLDVSL